MDYIKVLCKAALFEGISEPEIKSIVSCLGLYVKTFEKNQIIFSEGDKADKFGILLDGKIRITKDDYDGNRSILSLIHPLELFSESYACSDIKIYPASSVAELKSTVLLIEVNRIFISCIDSCEIHKQLLGNLMRIISNKNVMLNRKIDFMSRRTTKEKIMAYLHSEAEKNGSNYFTIPFDRQSLADYLGVERSAMSAEIGKLRDEGIIEVNKSNFRLLK